VTKKSLYNIRHHKTKLRIQLTSKRLMLPLVSPAKKCYSNIAEIVVEVSLNLM
jgi:hypothetical protein